MLENGFGFETHSVITKDGYVLNLFRILPTHKVANMDAPAPPVFMQHGIIDSADCWIMNHPNVAPAF